MKNAIIVRQAVLTDLEVVASLFDEYRQFYGQPSDISIANEFLKARFNHLESILFLAIQNNTAIGFAQLYPSFSSILVARTFILNDLFVYESSRRMGAATKLISASADYASRLGAARLTLSTAVTNNAAQALYKSLGWKQDENFDVYHLFLT